MSESMNMDTKLRKFDEDVENVEEYIYKGLMASKKFWKNPVWRRPSLYSECCRKIFL